MSAIPEVDVEDEPHRAVLGGIPALLLLVLVGIGIAVTWHYSSVHLLGWMRILADVLIAVAAGLLVLAVPIPWRRGPVLITLAVSLVIALVLAGVLIGAGLWMHRARGADAITLVTTGALAKGDRVISAPGTGPGSAVLVRRAAGPTDVIEPDRGRVDRLSTSKDDVVALSADASRAIVVHDGTTVVYRLAGKPRKEAEIAGEPVALVRSRLVVRACEGSACEQRGYDLATSASDPQWAVADASGGWGPDAAGRELPAADAEPSALLDVPRTTGVLPATALRFAPDTGWMSVDPVTGEARGTALAPADAPCRVVVDPVGDGGAVVSTGQRSPDAITVCRDAEGALTATADDNGAVLWSSDASPAGTWSVRVLGGRVLASAPAAGGDKSGRRQTEILASGTRRAWTAPAGDASVKGEDAAKGDDAGKDSAAGGSYRSRLGLDGERVVLAQGKNRIVALEAATGAPLWTLSADPGRYAFRAALASDTLVLLEPAPRTHPLDPRTAVRLRVVDARTGDVVASATLPGYPTNVIPVSGQRALVVDAEGAHLVGER